MSKMKLYALMLTVMMLWGFNVIAIKVIVEVFDPAAITAFRIFVAGLTVMALVIIWREIRWLTKKEGYYVFVATITGVVAHHFFLAIGVANTTASNAGLIAGLVPLLTTLFAAMFLGDRLTVSKSAGILFGLVGVAFIILNGSGSISSISKGDLFVFLSITAQAISFIFIKKGTETMSPRLMTGWMLLFGSGGLLITSLLLNPSGIQTFSLGTPFVWVVFVSSAVFATALGHSMYNYTIQHLGPGETAIFINMTPFFALLGSYLFLGETITPVQIFGFLLIIIGVLLGTGAVKPSLFKINRHKRAY